MGVVLVCGCKQRPAGKVLGPGQGVCVGWPPFPVGSDGAVFHTVCYSFQPLLWVHSHVPLHYSSLLQAYAMMLSLSENAPLHTSSQNSLGAWLDMAGAASESGTFNPINHL